MAYIEEVDYAKVRDGEVFPHYAHALTIIDMDARDTLERLAVEVNAKSGWADVYVEYEQGSDWRKTERIRGNFRMFLIEGL